MFLQILISILFFTEVNGLYFTSVYKNETDGQIYLDVKGIANSTFEEQHELLKLINAILIQQSSGPKTIVEGDYLPTMIKMLNSKNTTIQFDTLVTLFTIANISAEYAEAIFDENAIPALLEITTSDSSDEITTVFSLEILKIIIKHDFSSMTEKMKSTIAGHISKFIHSNKASSTHVLNNAIGIMSSLCQSLNSPPLPSNDINVFVIPAIGKCIRQDSAASETITFSLASLGMLTLSDQQQQQLYFDDEIIKELFQLVNHKNESIQLTSIYVLGNIFAAEKDSQRIEALFDHTIFETFSKIFKNGNPEMVKVVASFIPKLFRSSKSFIESFIKSTAFSALMELIAENGNAAQADDAHLILLITITYGDYRHILLLDHMNVISKLCHALMHTSSIIDDQNLLKMTLHAFAAILQKSENYKCVIFENLEKCGAMEIIDEFEKTHDMDEIRALSKVITSFNRLQKLEGTCSKQF